MKGSIKVRHFNRFNPIKNENRHLIVRNVQILEKPSLFPLSYSYFLTLCYLTGSPVNRKCEAARLVRQNKTLMRVKKWEV